MWQFFKVLNHLSPANPIPVPVVAVNEAGTFRLAPAPNTIPAGFIKYKFEFPPVT
jgi:hypothetical protein